MEAFNLDGLSTEIQCMIVDILPPSDIASLHSTSRRWNSLTEALYTEIFYEKLYVFVENGSLQRLKDISRNDKCRKRVKRLALAPWVIGPEHSTDDDYYSDSTDVSGNSDATDRSDNSNSTGSADGPNALMPPKGPYREHKRLLESQNVATVITEALRSLENCTSLRIEPEVDFGRNNRMNELSFYYIKDFYLPGTKQILPGQHGRRFMSRILQTTLAIAVECHQISSLGLTGIYYDVECGLDWRLLNAPQKTQRLTYIRDLEITLSHETWEGETSCKRFASFLRTFPKLRKLDLSFEEEFSAEDIPSIGGLVVGGLEELHIKYLECSIEDMETLVKDKRLETLKQLHLHWLNMSGGVDAWVAVLTMMCGHLKLDTLKLFYCLSDGNGLTDDVTEAGNVFVYSGLNENKTGDLVERFKAWIAESNRIAVKCPDDESAWVDTDDDSAQLDNEDPIHWDDDEGNWNSDDSRQWHDSDDGGSDSELIDGLGIPDESKQCIVS